MDSLGNIYIADAGSARLRAVNTGSITRTIAAIQIPAGYIQTIAGGGTTCTGGDSFGNGCPATQAGLSAPAGVALDATGNLYIADTSHQEVREVAASNGYIFDVAGDGTGYYSGDGGPATSATLNEPYRVAVDAAGNVYIADSSNNCVRKVVQTIIFTLAGNGSAGLNTGCTVGFYGDLGPPYDAELRLPTGVAADGRGNVYIGDAMNNRVRVVGSPTTAIFSGGTLSGGNSGLSLVGDTITQYSTTGARGTVSLSTGSLATGNIQIGATFRSGGSARTIRTTLSATFAARGSSLMSNGLGFIAKKRIGLRKLPG